MMAMMRASAAAASCGDGFETAHAKLLADPTLQFVAHTQSAPRPPAWGKEIGEFFEMIAPAMTYVFWAGCAVITAFILYALWRQLRERAASSAPRAAEIAPAPAPAYVPTPARARALLQEADALAAAGRFSEAARALLHRSIEDIERAHPGAVRTHMTSREIALAEILSGHGRTVFSAIARAVETSLFGARPLDAVAFAACRAAYQDFAQGAQRA